MKAYPLQAARVFGTPLAIHAAKAEVIANAFYGFMLGRATAMEDDEVLYSSKDGDSTPYEIVEGVAIIQIAGVLVHKAGWLDAACGMRGYNAIRSDFLSAIDNDNVRAIALAVDSPGGEVSGCFDLVDLIYESRGRKPICAILDDSAYSAAYAIASAADVIYVPRTGGTGSVGVIAMHAEYSKAQESAGIAVTIFQYGDRKSDGNEHAPLSKEARKRFQADVDTMGDLFVSTVARNRGISSARVRATQAGTYLGAEGVQVGFADAVAAPDEAFRALVESLSTPT